MENVTLLAAFLAGIISFLSPCVLPIVPGYISFISGLSMDEMKDKANRPVIIKKASANSLLFIAGFSVVFILLGASATFVGQFLLSRMAALSKVAGVMIIVFGLHTAGVFKIKFLDYEKRFQVKDRRFGFVGAFLVGLAFAFGWSPCIGPILAGILVYAGTRETVGQGILLLSVYSAGLGLPFFLTGLGMNTFWGFFGRVKRHFRAVELSSGLVLVAVGILIFTNNLARFAGYLPFLNKFAR